MVSAETIQPLMFSDCDNSTAAAAAEDMNAYINSLIPKTTVDADFFLPSLGPLSTHFLERRLPLLLVALFHANDDRRN